MVIDGETADEHTHTHMHIRWVKLRYHYKIDEIAKCTDVLQNNEFKNFFYSS